MLFALLYLLRRLVRLITGYSGDLSGDLELVVLRHQLMVLKRQAGRPRLRRRDRLFMAAVSRALPRARWSSFVVSPQTLLRWHRELVRSKWTHKRISVGGRPPITEEVRELILRMGRENPRWGCLRIQGELAKLGMRVSATKIRTLLRANGLGPAPHRDGPTWSEFIRSRRGDSGVRLLHRGDRLASHAVRAVRDRVRIPSRARPRRHQQSRLGVGHPASAEPGVGERLSGLGFLIRDRDAKFTGSFDEVFRSEGVKVIETPIRAPRANAFAERWVRTVRTECLDWILVIGRRHLERVLRGYVSHYNAGRPHRGLGLKTPDPRPDPVSWPAIGASVRRRDVLGGLIHEYEPAA